jgi:hypothetical protein
MDTCADINDGEVGSALANMIRAQAARAVKASEAFLKETAKSPSTVKESAFMAAHNLTDWFRRTVFTETVVDLTRKSELLKMLLYPRPLAFSFAETRIPEIQILMGYGVTPIPYPTLEVMLNFANADEAKQFESKASAEDKKAVVDDYQLPVFFLHNLDAQLGKCKASELVKISTYGEFHLKTPGQVAMKDFKRSMGLGLLVGAITKSTTDQYVLGQDVGLVVPTTKDIGVLNDFADVIKANPEKVKDFHTYLTDVSDGGKREELFNIGIVQCTETRSIKQRAAIREVALRHLIRTVRPYLAAGYKSATLDDFDLKKTEVKKSVEKGDETRRFEDFFKLYTRFSLEKSRKKKNLKRGILLEATRSAIERHGAELPPEIKTIIGLIVSEEAQVAAAVYSCRTEVNRAEFSESEEEDE